MKISVVIPVYNEEKILPILLERLEKSLSAFTNDYEVIFINDASTDNSLSIIKSFNNNNPRIKCLSFSRNFGHQMAITAGLASAKAEAVIVMDGDLQDPPEIIPEFIKKWQEGYKVVYGVRKKRKEHILKRASYSFFYRLLKKISKINIPLDAGDFCLMDKEVLDILNSLPETTRFVRGLRSWIGFKQIGVSYERDKRYAGKAKYTFTKLIALAIDGLISFSDFPLRILIGSGLLISLASFLYGIIILIKHIFNIGVVAGWTTLAAAIFFFGGVQLICFGILGGYISKIFDEVKRRPFYIIESKIGFN